MPTYKLTYFKAKGAAEVARYIMAYGDIGYEDIRLEGQQWQDFKPKTPYGQLPVLEVDGEMICQSKTLTRYLAKKAGLMGKSDLEEAKVNMIVDCMIDFVAPLITFLREQEGERKEELRKSVQDSLPSALQKLEDLLPGDHFVGNQMTWADLEVAYNLDFPDKMGFTMNSDDFPKLKALKDKVNSHPKIAAWIAKRPETQY